MLSGSLIGSTGDTEEFVYAEQVSSEDAIKRMLLRGIRLLRVADMVWVAVAF